MQLDTHTIGTELRAALEGLGLTADRITVRTEPVPGQLWIRVTVMIGGQAIDVHTLADYWPPAASTARSIRWVLRYGKQAALYGTVGEWVAGFTRMSSGSNGKIAKTTRVQTALSEYF